jgi:hypothetical protein
MKRLLLAFVLGPALAVAQTVPVTTPHRGATPTAGTIDSSGNQTLYSYLRFFAAEARRYKCAPTSACNIDSYTSGSSVHHIRLYSGTEIDSEGTAAVTVNNTATSGTGGLTVYEGGTNYNVQAFRVDNGGNIYTPQVHSLTGTRFLCVNASGQFVSSTTACSGT